MLPLYLGCLVFGGVLIAVSLFGADHGEHGGGDAHALATHDGPHDQGPSAALWPLLTFRFWFFALGFFGLTGALLTLVGTGGPAVTAPIAALVGAGAGYAASRLLGALSGAPVGLVPAAGAHVGREGRLLLPVGKGRRGKVRLEGAGGSLDLVAETEGDALLLAGSTVLIVSLRGTVAIVEPNPAASELPSKEIS